MNEEGKRVGGRAIQWKFITRDSNEKYHERIVMGMTASRIEGMTWVGELEQKKKWRW